MDQNTMGMGTPEMPKQQNLKQKGTPFLIAGILIAILNVALKGLKLPFADIISQITGISIFIAIILLFLKEYRHIGKKYLIGIFGTLIGTVVFGFILTLIVAAMKK
jgi:hypothetical protein